MIVYLRSFRGRLKCGEIRRARSCQEQRVVCGPGPGAGSGSDFGSDSEAELECGSGLGSGDSGRTSTQIASSEGSKECLG